MLFSNAVDGYSSLLPGDVTLYTWQEPAAKRELLWSCGETQNKVDDLVKVWKMKNYVNT